MLIFSRFYFFYPLSFSTTISISVWIWKPGHYDTFSVFSNNFITLVYSAKFSDFIFFAVVFIILNYSPIHINNYTSHLNTPDIMN